jgi:hypothetical protein
MRSHSDTPTILVFVDLELMVTAWLCGILPRTRRVPEPAPKILIPRSSLILLHLVADCIGARVKRSLVTAWPKNVSGPRCCHSAISLGSQPRTISDGVMFLLLKNLPSGEHRIGDGDLGESMFGSSGYPAGILIGVDKSLACIIT